MTLGNNEKRMLRALLSNPEGEWNLNEILDVTEWTDQVHVAGAGQVSVSYTHLTLPTKA